MATGLFFFCKKVKIEPVKQILDSPLWFNSNFNIGNRFIKDWFQKGITTIYDLIDRNGNWYDFERLKEAYGIKGTFLNYLNVLNSIPNSWKDVINENKVYSILNKTNVKCNVYVNFVIKNKKGSRIFYDIITGVSEVNTHLKWQETLGQINENEWKFYHSSINKVREIKLKDFQYKINNKILVTNSFLRNINKIDSNLCSYCQLQEEAIKHLFLECQVVKQFWHQLKAWLETQVNVSFQIDDRTILFSFQSTNELTNYLHVLSKYYIYKNKF